MRKQAIDWEKTLAKDTYNKGLLSETYEELIKVNPVKKQAKDLNRHLTKEDIYKQAYEKIFNILCHLGIAN